MDKFYEMSICGLKRQLPLCEVSKSLDIAAFIMFSDVEITVKCAEELLKKAPKHDIILTAESKGIPLAYEMAKQAGTNYIVARKSPKVYTTSPIVVEVKSITTANVQRLCLGQTEVNLMTGKRILIVDDVISTGESVQAMEELLSKIDCKLVGKMAVLAEGDAADRKDISYLERLPLFFK